MKSRAEVIKYCLTFSETFEVYPFLVYNWTYLPGFMSVKSISGSM